MSNITIHKKENRYETIYYFTKTKNHCLRIEYDPRNDYGKSSSGCHFREIEIHYHNSFLTDELTEINLEEVPQAVKDLLSFIS